MADASAKMSPLETRSSLALAAVYALRMLGMFLVLPVFSLYAATLGATNKAAIGLALGAYGLTQALLQLPLGMASDWFGRKRVIYVGLLVFALGSFMAALAHDLPALTLARALQGAGAVSAAVTALLADLTREEVRTRAMAMIGLSIGATFSLSLVGGPVLEKWIGVPGMFALTGVLALATIAVVCFIVPEPRALRAHPDAQANRKALPAVLNNPQLLRLDFGIFALHAGQMALFMALPFALTNLGLTKNQHWQMYLPVALIGFAFMVPAIIYGEKRGQLKRIFVLGIACLLVAQTLLVWEIGTLKGIFASLVIYFAGFNILEAVLPSLVSKIASAHTKGTAMGVYNTAQSLGLFAGGALGGVIFEHYSFRGVFAFVSALMLLWLIIAATAPKPLPVRNLMWRLPESIPIDAMLECLQGAPGVVEVSVSSDSATLFLKVMQQGFDERLARNIVYGEPYVSQ